MIKNLRCGSSGCTNSRTRHTTLCALHTYIRGRIPSARYRKTLKGFIMTRYALMRRRVLNPNHQRHIYYKNKKLLSKNDFYVWARASYDLLSLYKKWVSTGYNLKFTPTVNRIDSNLGYKLGNMEWVTYSHNSALASITKVLNTKQNKAIRALIGV